MVGPANQPEPEEGTQPGLPQIQFEAAAQRASDIASAPDAIFFRQMQQYVSQPPPAQDRLERAQAAYAASTQQVAPQYHHAQYQNVQRPLQAPGPQYHPAQQSTPQQIPRQAPHPGSNTIQSWQARQWAQSQLIHGSQHGVGQNNMPFQPQRVAQPSAQSSSRQSAFNAPDGTAPPNGQLHQPEPVRSFKFNPQHTPSPSVTPNQAASTNRSPVTPQVASSTPASTIGEAPSSNLASKQQASRRHTRVQDIQDPAICHICYHMVVLKSSIKNHLVGVHSMSKEDAAAMNIYTKSELIAQGHQIPSGLKPSRITSNTDAAIYSSKKYALNLNTPGTTTPDKVNDPTKASEEVKREPGPHTLVKVSTPAYPPLTTPGVPTAPQVSGNPDAVSDSRKRYTLSLYPPGLAGSDQGSGPVVSKSVKDPPAIGGVFTGVNTASGQLSATSNAGQLGEVTNPSAVSKAPITPVAAQIVSTVPAKRKYEAATTPEVHVVLNGGPHKPTSQKISKLTGKTAAAQPNGAPKHATVGQTHLGWDSLSPGLKDALNNILIQAQALETIIPWMNGVNESLRRSREEGRTFSAHELMAVAHAALTEVSDYTHDTDSSDDPEPDFPSPHSAARNAVIRAVDYHQGGIAAASMEREIDAMARDDGGRGEKEESPRKRMKMSYGEILVPDDYAIDERLANVDDRDEATDAEGHAGPRSSPEPVAREGLEPVVEVYDDPYRNEEGSEEYSD